MSNMDKSVVDFSDSAFEDYESLGADHEQVLKAHAPPLNAGLSSVMPPRKRVVRSKQDVLGSTLLSGSATTTSKFVLLSCTNKKKTTMNNFEIINFNERMEFQVYKFGGCSHDNIDDEIIDGSVILEILNESL
jgi:hypothetical protein